jgi:hypothetical protein
VVLTLKLRQSVAHESCCKIDEQRKTVLGEYSALGYFGQIFFSLFLCYVDGGGLGTFERSEQLDATGAALSVPILE